MTNETASREEIRRRFDALPQGAASPRACSKCGGLYSSMLHRDRCLRALVVRDPASTATSLNDGIDVDDYVLCAYPGCFIRTRKPDEHGLCPQWLWTEGHFRFVATLRGEG